MNCKNLDDNSNRIKNSMKSNLKCAQQQGKTGSFGSVSSNCFNSTANNTSPIVCAVCGSKEYVTIHTQEKSFGFGNLPGWNCIEPSKKSSISADLGQPLSPLAQTIFPHLSLFHFPQNVYYSHYNSTMRLPSNPYMPIDKYYSDNQLDLETAKQTPSLNSESTMFPEMKEPVKKKNNTVKLNSNVSCRKEDSNFFRNNKDDSRPPTAFTNASEVRNYPLVHPPWMGNICPVFPCTYASFAFPVNQPLIPIYLPVPSKWQSVDVQNEEEIVDDSVGEAPIGDGASVNHKNEKKSDGKEENNVSDYEFEILARELIMDQKSNYDEEDEIELNIDEITSSLKMPEVNSGREINSEKFFNSKEQWIETAKEECAEKDDWKLSREINMQDWESVPDYECSGSNYNGDCKHDNDDGHVQAEETERIGDGIYYEETPAWVHERNRSQEEPEMNNRMNWKKGNEKKDYPEEKLSPDSGRMRDYKPINEQVSKVDTRYHDYGEETENSPQAANECETQQPKEDNYKEDEYPVHVNPSNIILTGTNSRSSNLERINEGETPADVIKKKCNRTLKTITKKQTNQDQSYYNWDKINEILECHDKKVSDVEMVLRNKETVAGSNTEDSSSGADKKKQTRNVVLTIFNKYKHNDPKSDPYHAEKLRKIECKNNGITQPITTNIPTKNIKREEKVKPMVYANAKCDSLKIPVASPRKIRKPEDLKKRWLT